MPGFRSGRNGTAGEGFLVEPKVVGDHPSGTEACFGRAPAPAPVQCFRLPESPGKVRDSTAQEACYLVVDDLRAVATTGVPASSASIMTMPKGSGH